ncbi:MAG TPA: Gfo/Idh/MocA family oxidoreductase [Candidatus Eisenbacteria bacterium]|nr:Gfo/Idh/MocA family oxidoreductase [Candidatus Eisenbacteria bacterium]
MTTPSTSDTINVGLIGFGLAGRAFHAPVIGAVPGLRLAAILQRTGSDAAQAYPNARIVRTLDELLALPEIRLIVIATPNETHYPLAHQCLASGRDVLVDKPFTTTMAEALDLIQFAKKCGRLLTVYQSRRYDGDFQGILQLAAAGTLGRIVRFETHYDRFRPNLKPNAWRERQAPGAGILFDIGPHLIDHAFQLFGLPMAMAADVRNERGGPADDAFDLLLHYPGNVRAALGSSILAAAPRTRFVALGDKAAFTKNSFDPQEIRLRFGNIPKEGPWGAEPEENWGVLTQINADGTPVHRRIPPAATDYRDYYANLRDALQGRAEPAVTHRQMLEIMQALELARQSSNQRRTLDWPRDLQPRS